ncbi:hypothetical protein Tsubulata_050712 [Turnera subulata]|uniref:PsbP C-terminal domain-containing protein n=1 Tax=Turnera subulata TaxID=218843 RepID=A0A9Q0GA40_9ROSI|nr:hypothetical protein Tsubulata_050712 [Turnera subulata]
MATTSSLSLSCVSTTLAKKLINVPHSHELTPPPTASPAAIDSITCTRESTSGKESDCKRRLLLLGIGALATSLVPVCPLLAAEAKEVPKGFEAFVDLEDGYSYYHPLNWVDFDFLGHDSAFKDRVFSIHNCRVRFRPTKMKDIKDLGPIDEVVYNLLNHVYNAVTQIPTVYNVEERNIDGRNYYFFEYRFTSPNYSSCSFANITIANALSEIRVSMF